MYVRLSDGIPVKTATKKPDSDFPFIYIPQSRMYIREDYLDDLDDFEWRELMAQIASFQPQVQGGQMSEAQFMCDRATRKKKREEKKADKKAKKDLKASDKHEKKSAKTEIKKAKAEGKRSGKGGAGGIVGTIMSGVSSFLNKDSGDTLETPSGKDEIPPPEYPETVPFYRTPLGITLIATGTVAVVGGGIYLATRNRN